MLLKKKKNQRTVFRLVVLHLQLLVTSSST